MDVPSFYEKTVKVFFDIAADYPYPFVTAMVYHTIA